MPLCQHLVQACGPGLHAEHLTAHWQWDEAAVRACTTESAFGNVQDPTSGEYAKARNSNLNEDLGKVEYVFSDKTGTLTSNEMQLREIAVKTIPLGSAEFK